LGGWDVSGAMHQKCRLPGVQIFRETARKDVAVMRALISGMLHDAPTMKTSKAGKEFYIGKVKDDSTNPVTWTSIVCFDEQAAILAGMKKGDALSVSGKLTVDVYQPAQGDPRANISITCDNIITLKQAKQQKSSGNDYKNRDSKGGGFDVNKFKGASGYSDKQAPPPPPDEGDPF
jgi:single-stranded DNA-binding protein